MDTRINLSDPDSLFITRQELRRRLALADPPLLLDVRPHARFECSARMLACARRCSPEDVPALAVALFA